MRAVIVPLGCALISKVIIGWWCLTPIELQVPVNYSWIVVAFSLAASVTVEPLHVAVVLAPVADGHGHTTGAKRVLHVRKIVSATIIGVH